MGLIKSIVVNPLTLWMRWLVWKYVNQYRHASVKLSIGYMARFRNCHFGYCNKLYPEVSLSNVSLGDYSYVSPRSRISNAEIGKFSCIGPEVVVGLGKHPSRGFVTSHPSFYSTRGQAIESFVEESIFGEYAPITIGNDVWIGARSIVLDGVKSGDGAIVGAGAVVTRDVEPYAVVAGSPATLVRYRFDADDIECLLQFKWWERDRDWLRENVSSFRDIKEFVGLCTGNEARKNDI